MSEQENVRVIRANVEALNANDAEAFGRLRAADFAADAPGVATPLTVEQTWRFNQGYLAAFPDARLDVTRLIAQGDDVVAHDRATGIHTAPWRTPSGNSIPATGKTFAVTDCSSYELIGGQIARQWDVADMISLFRQLGVMPPYGRLHGVG
jgi:steroid delta-isomerase-like uncharacterized protein